MKLKLAEYYSDKYPKGHVFEIDDIMRSADCASGVKVRVHMGKSPTWLDLGWFVPQNKTRSNGLRYPRRACNLSNYGGRGAASGARFVGRRLLLRVRQFFKPVFYFERQ